MSQGEKNGFTPNEATGQGDGTEGGKEKMKVSDAERRREQWR